MENTKLRRRIDLTGQVFGRLTVINPGERRSKNRGMFWTCKCECGIEKEIDAHALVIGSTVSCGCFSKEANSNKAKHGHNRRILKKSLTYKSWDKMIQRCTNPNCEEFKFYGDRGISVCDRWRDFSNFLTDMGVRINGTSIDRINHNGNYEPDNCRWADKMVQANNTRRNVIITFNSQSKTVAEWALELGLKYDTLYYRLFRYNYPIEIALNPIKIKACSGTSQSKPGNSRMRSLTKP